MCIRDRGKAEEAIQFYTGIFPHSYIHSINRFKVDEEDVEGTVKHAMFILSDKVFTAMDSSAPQALAFNEGVSIVIPCKTQEEIDYYWTNLTQGGEEGKCGWLKDKYGAVSYTHLDVYKRQSSRRSTTSPS